MYYNKKIIYYEKRFQNSQNTLKRCHNCQKDALTPKKDLITVEIYVFMPKTNDITTEIYALSYQNDFKRGLY